MGGRRIRCSALICAASVVVLVATVHGACADDAASGAGSGSASATTTTGPPATARSKAALRAAAVSWAKTFLTGSAAGMLRLEGPECRPTSASSSLPKSTITQYLQGLRASMRRELGKPLLQIHVRAVELRNVAGNRGEAQVIYDLPEQKVGNDNWVEFTLHDGHWKVSNCHAPILGNSTRSGSAAPTPP